LPALPALPDCTNNIMSGAHPRPMGERRQRSGRRSRDNAQIASERMAILFRQAEQAARRGEPELSDRYVSLARSIGMRYNVRIPSGLKRRACRKCGAFLVPGKNLRVRLRGGKSVWTCLKCGNISRVKTAPRPPPSRP
jgi:ribonuclease P protein subunit RPR2